MRVVNIQCVGKRLSCNLGPERIGKGNVRKPDGFGFFCRKDTKKLILDCIRIKISSLKTQLEGTYVGVVDGLECCFVDGSSKPQSVHLVCGWVGVQY